MTDKWRCEALAALIGALLLATILLGSIDRGAIQGTVTDQQGGVVPGAKVVVENVDTNVEVHLTTNSAGFYLATSWYRANTRFTSKREASPHKILPTSWFRPELRLRRTPSSL